MNIYATSNTSATKSIKNNAGQENIKQLEQQKQILNKELESLKQNNKLNPEEKSKKIKDIQKRLQAIENQIQISKQNASKNSEPIKKFKLESKDTISISPKGKAMSLIDNLMKQKEQINERKNELISTTLESGGDIGSIERQLESYAEQLTSIDEQISSAMAKEVEKEKNEPNSYQKSEPKTKEEVINNRLSDMLNLSSDIKQMEVTQAVKNRVDGEVRVLKSQVKTDQGDTKESKLEQISNMENISSNLSNQIGEHIVTTNKQISNNTTIDSIGTTKKEHIETNGNDSVPQDLNTTYKL